MYSPIVLDKSFSTDGTFTLQPSNRLDNSCIQDDCPESPEIVILSDSYFFEAENNTKYTLDMVPELPDMMFGFTAELLYDNFCEVGGMWFDLEFAHYAEQIEIDVAGDGDMEYAFTEPAFDMFGRQTKFHCSKDAKQCPLWDKRKDAYTRPVRKRSGW